MSEKEIKKKKQIAHTKWEKGDSNEKKKERERREN